MNKTKGINYSQVMDALYALENPEKIQFKQDKFAIKTSQSLGIYHKDLKELAKKIGTDSELALQLFDSGIYEARILCSKIFNPDDITEALMEKWVAVFDTWEICDSFCMGFFVKSGFALKKVFEWSDNDKEFIKRAAFSMMAAYGFAHKKADNKLFEQFLPIIIREANDGRVYVKKAVNWALRNIGKRNSDLQVMAINTANIIAKQETKSAKWIASNAITELTKAKVNVLDYPRHIYRIK